METGPRDIEMRESFLSDRHNSISSLNESNDIIVENLDGTYYQGIKIKKLNPQNENNNDAENNFNGYPRNRIVYVVDEDEIAYYARMYELPTRVEEFVALILKHQKYLAIMLLLFLFLEITMGPWITGRSEKEIVELQKMYQIPDRAFMEKICTIVEAIYAAIYYILGLTATIRKSIRLYIWFSLVSVLGLVLHMLLAFINQFNIATFMFRFFALIHSKFLNQLLMSLLLLPR